MKTRRFLAALTALTMLAGSTASAKKSYSAPDVTAAIMELDLDGNNNASDPVTVNVSGLPSKVDLRDRGVVPAIRNQDPWGTCWGFGSIAACEISILSDLGLTCEQFKAKYGYDLDLSERHLAWFGTYHMPEVTASDADASETDVKQAGEGQHNSLEITSPNNAHFNVGGITSVVSSVFSAGFGPAMESDVPYTANDGTLSEDADWSVSEEYRFTTEFDLLDSNIFPAPAQVDSDGNYTYNEQATNAIKREIANGHAVAITYHADASTPDEAKAVTKAKPEANQKNFKLNVSKSGSSDSWDELEDEIVELGCSEEEAEIMISFLENASTKGMSDDDIELCAEIAISLFADDSDVDTMLDELDEGEIDAGDILDEVISLISSGSSDDGDSDDEDEDSDSDDDETVYINYDTCAQYTDDASASSDHCVCIIGYDDSYAVENFLADHQPPAPGAWICRNSWGSDWGNDGYFYLSYYDKTISAAESFTFDVSSFDNETEGLEVLNYDFMQIEVPLAVYPSEEVSLASVFTTDDDDVLSSVSLFTAVENTDAVMSVYLLNRDAQEPDDGTLLDTQTLHFDYAGYHRVNLNGNFLISGGSRLSLVVSQTTVQNGESVPVLPISANQSKEEAEIDEDEDEEEGGTTWYEARVNAGESFVLDSGKWVDWKTVIDELNSEDSSFSAVVIDNPSLKLYLFPYDELQEIHDLDDTTTNAEGQQVSVCSEDGYTVIH